MVKRLFYTGCAIVLLSTGAAFAMKEPQAPPVEMCQHPGKPSQKGVSVSRDHVNSRKAKGDIEGPCPPPGSAKIDMCQSPGRPSQKTVSVSQKHINSRKAHGYTEGACPASPWK